MGARALLVGALVAVGGCTCTSVRAQETTTGAEMPYVAPLTDTTTFYEGTTTGYDDAGTTSGYVFDLGPPPPPIPPDLPPPNGNAISEISGPAGNAISEIDGPQGAQPSEIDGPSGNAISEIDGPPGPQQSDPISEIPPGR